MKRFILVLALLSILFTIPLLSAAQNSVKISPEVVEALESSNTVRVIVKLNEMPSNRYTTSSGLTLRDDFESFDGFADQLSLNQIEQMALDNSVESITLSHKYKLLRQESMPLIQASNTTIDYGYNGSGITVAVIDTGIDSNHIELNNVVNSTVTCSDYLCNDTNDYSGHGTHIAGIIGGSGNGSVKGVAPGVNLLNVKVFYYDETDNTFYAWDDDIIQGIEWAVSQGAEVLSLSLGGGLSSSYCDSELLANETNWAVDQGAVVAIASGNSFSNSSISYPSCASKVISVGASDDYDAIASFTNRNSILDILAPGVNIDSTYSCLAAGDCSSNDWYSTKSGTSMATPHVSGAVALLLQANNLLNASQIETVLKDTGKIIYDSETGLNFPRLNIFSAVRNVTDVQINEIMPKPSVGPDWVELYNPLSFAVNLSGWKINDSSSTTASYNFNDMEIIRSKEFIVVNVSNRLNNGGETVTLLNNFGAVIDNLTYSNSFQNESIGYISDNQSKSLANFTSSTKGYSNFQPPFNLSHPENIDLIPNQTFAYDFNVTNSGINLNERYVSFTVNITPNVGVNYSLNNSGAFTFSSNLSNQFYNITINVSDNLDRGAVSQFEIRVFKILFSNFSASNLTTDLTAVNLSNVTKLVLASDDYGIINFTIPSEGRNLLGLDLDEHIDIRNNFVYLNSSSLSILNLSAELTLENISVAIPNITRNGIQCPDNICTLISYNSSLNAIKFNVTSFSYYSIEEKKVPPTPPPSNSPSDSGGSGGGSGGGSFGGSSNKLVTEEPARESLNVSVENNIGNMQIDVKDVGSNPQDTQNGSIGEMIAKSSFLTGAVIGVSLVDNHPIYSGLVLLLFSILSVKLTKSLRLRRKIRKYE